MVLKPLAVISWSDWAPRGHTYSPLVDLPFFHSSVASLAFCALFVSPLVALAATATNDMIIRSIIAHIQASLKTFTSQMRGKNMVDIR